MRVAASTCLVCLLSLSFPLLLEKGKVRESVNLVCTHQTRETISFAVEVDGCAFSSVPEKVSSHISNWAKRVAGTSVVQRRSPECLSK